jgi:conjugal transfer/type IV secretion protein DotA/TraY
MRLVVLLFLFVSAPALAADLFSPVEGDLSIAMLLQPVFGSLFGGESDGPLGEAIMLFNSCILLIGGVIAGYVLIAGTAQTAHEGSMLGNKWSSMWVPIRLVVGIGAVVPAGGTYCVAQMLVAWLAIQGIGLADAVWSAFTRSAFASQNIASTTLPTPTISKLAFGMLRSQVCMQGYRHLHADGENSALILPSPPVTTGEFTTVRRYGVPGLSDTQCGGVTGSEASGGAMATTAGFFGISTGAAEKAAAIRAAHTTAAEVMESRLAALAIKIADDMPVSAQSEYVAAIQAYQDTLAETAKAQLGDQAYFERLAQNAAQDGWVLAGSWFMRFAAIQDAVLKAIADAPTAMPVQKAPESMATDMNRYFAALQGAVRDPTKTGIDNQLLADKEREDSETGLVMSAINAVFNKINEGTTAGFNFLTEADIDQHPLVVASSAGHTMISWGLALAVASVIAAKIGGTTIALVLGGFVMALLAGGASLAYLLPMIPFMIWVGATAGWLLTVIEAVLGAPLWAVAHLNPQGEELAGSARAGYMLILEMMLKPVLMVFGLAFAVLVSLPLGILINRVFYSTFSLTQGGFTGFVGMLAAVGIYSALMLSMMKWTFSFIHKVPDQIFKWMGGGHGSGLAEASSAAAAAEHQSGAVVGAVGGAVAGAMTSRINQLSQKVAQTEDRKRQGGDDQEGGLNSGSPAGPAGDKPVQPIEANVAGQLGEAKATQENEADKVADDAFKS